MAIFKAAAMPPKTVKGLRALLSYVLRGEKTEDKLVDGIGDFQDFAFGYDYDQDRVYREFRRVQQEYGKTNGRLCAHYIMSFPPGETTAEAAHSIGIELVERLWPDHQVLVVTHIDKEHLHDHFIVNSVAYTDGRKLHTKKSDLGNMKAICDQVCQSHDLSVPEKGKHADGSDMAPDELTTGSKALWNLAKEGKDSYIVDCATCIKKILPSAVSKNDFCSQMLRYGWTVNWSDDRKHITFVDDSGHRVRDSKITKTFNMTINKDDLEKVFQQNEKASIERQSAEQKDHRQRRRHHR